MLARISLSTSNLDGAPTFIKLVRTGAPDFGERIGEVVG
jgi:hypothetical protein